MKKNYSYPSLGVYSIKSQMIANSENYSVKRNKDRYGESGDEAESNKVDNLLWEDDTEE